LIDNGTFGQHHHWEHQPDPVIICAAKAIRRGLDSFIGYGVENWGW
jgi:hypothetical protein